MATQDLKRVIAAFLALASISASVALVWSSIGNEKTVFQKEESALKETGPEVGANAFVESLPERPGAEILNIGERTNEAADIDENNLTQNFLNTFIPELASQNPLGPTPTTDGKNILNLPTEKVISELLLKEIQGQKFEIDNRFTDADINISEAVSSSDIENYAKSFEALLKAKSDKFVELLGQEQTPPVIEAQRLVFDETILALKKMLVPRPLTGFHKGILSMIVNQKDIFNIVNNNLDGDPIKALLAFQSAPLIQERDFNLAKMEFSKISYLPLKKKFSLIPVANAIIAVVDNANLVKQIVNGGLLGSIIGINGGVLSGQTVFFGWVVAKKTQEEIFKKIMTAIIRMLINRLQAQLLQWVAGGGTPQFVTNWKDFLTKAGSDAAGIALGKIYPQLCSPFALKVPLTIARLQAPYEQAVSCSFGQIRNNLEAFYRDFRTGGWVSFSQVILPGGNEFGATIIALDAMTLERRRAQEAAKNEASASGGFLGIKKCIQKDLAGNCLAYNIETPGQTIGNAVAESLSWKPNEIINAQDIGQLIAALIDASITRVIKFSLAKAFSAGGGYDGYNYSTSGGYSASGGGILDENGNIIPGTGAVTPGSDIVTTQNNLIGILNEVNTTGSSTLAIYDQWFSTQPEVISLLEQVKIACSDLAQSADEKIAFLKDPVTVLEEEKAVQSMLNESLGLRTKVVNTTSSAVLYELSYEVSDLSSRMNKSYGMARNSYSDLLSLRNKADANLPDVCATPL